MALGHVAVTRQRFELEADSRINSKPPSLEDEYIAFYSGITNDSPSALCHICEDLKIDDFRFGGTIRSCERKDACQHLFFSDLPRDVYEYRGKEYEFMSLPVPFARKDELPGLPSLTASAANGCQFCSLLISILQTRGLTENNSIKSTLSITNAQYEWHTDPCRERWGDRWDAWGSKWEKEWDEANDMPCPHDISLYLFSLRVQVDYSRPFKLWFKISSPPISPEIWLRTPRRLPLEFPSSDDGGGRFTFKSWLSEHIKACKACQTPTRALYPTRLIDVGTSSGEEDPRLIITKEHPEIFDPVDQDPPRYLALSYCWGDNPSKKHTTTNENLREHCQRIPLEDFPAACRDAIRVTQSLCFRYLWIDACCIIQTGERDDDKDWQEESRKLSDTYSNAFLTIVPLASGSSSEGFLPARSKSARISFESAHEKEVRGAYWMHEVPTDSEDYDPKDFELRIKLSRKFGYRSATKDLKNSKWVTRGWTFNEALMSPRKLKFGAKSVSFECYGRQFTDRSLGRFSSTNDVLENHMFLSTMGEMAEEHLSNLGYYWTASQSRISHRHFTEPTDRLPAISSFAEYLQKKSGDEYIAGLFRSNFHRGLTWNKKTEDKCERFEDHLDKSFFRHGKEFYRSRFRDGEEPKDCYVAPSWSWVSTPSSSYLLHAWSAPTVKYADCDIEVEVQLQNKSNPFGLVKSGQIVLTSKAYRSDSMCLYMEGKKLMLKDNARLEADMHLDWTIQLGPDENLQISDSPRDEKNPLWKSHGPLNDMYLVPLIQESKKVPIDIYGLVIIPFPNQSDGSWMRAGIFMIHYAFIWNPFENCARKSFRVL